jgi:hypothetical protein
MQKDHLSFVSSYCDCQKGYTLPSKCLDPRNDSNERLDFVTSSNHPEWRYIAANFLLAPISRHVCLKCGEWTHHVPQQDSLIPPGRMITVGMRSRDGDPDKGIFWSLTLAHVRFYGGVVKT